MNKSIVFDDLSLLGVGDGVGDEVLTQTLAELRNVHRRRWIFRDICRECSAKYPCSVRSLIEVRFYRNPSKKFYYWVGGSPREMLEVLRHIWYRHRQDPTLRGWCATCDGKYPCRSRSVIDGRFWWSK